MTSGSTPFVSTKETTNYARLCRLLVDVGSQALRNTFDRIHPPASLHVVLTSPVVQRTLNSLCTGRRKILNSTQWGLLYPLHSPPTSASFDITLLTVLLRNVCGLTPPASGWDSLPAATATNTEDDIARVKYYRNTLYGHAAKSSIGDASFNTYWNEIRAALVRLGGASYGAVIDSLKTECMDPDCVKQYRLQLLEEWKEDDDNVKVKLEDMKDDISEKLVQVSNEMEGMKEKLDTHFKTKGKEIKGQEDISEKLEQMRADMEKMIIQLRTARKESKDEQDDNSEKLERMRTEIERIREKLDVPFRATTWETKEKGQLQKAGISEKLEQMRREIKSVGEKLDSHFGTTTDKTMDEDQLQLQTAIKSMKDNIKTGTEQPSDLQQPFRPNPGEGPEAKDLKMDQIYVNVIIHEGRLRYDFPTDRSEQLKVYPQPNANKTTSARLQDFVDGRCKNVLVVGRPGIGKTMLSTKLLRTWASDDAKMQTQFDVAFLLKLRHLNDETDLNLRELLACSETVVSFEGEVWKHIKENPSKVLLIFDGIDEFSAISAIGKDDWKYKSTLEDKMPVYTLYGKLASGKLLRGATVITTIRPTAVKWVRHLNFDRTIELLGFTSEQVEEYVAKFTEDHSEDAKETIWQHIRSNLNIFSLCYVPVNCFIICHCLLQSINICTDAAGKLPSKITDIYSMNVKIFFFKHCRDDKYSRSTTDLGTYIYKKFDDLQPENELVFKRLGKMAFNGMKEGRLIFESSEVGELENCGSLHRLPDVKPRKLSEPPRAQFCFTHLTVQEFFAAKHLTDTFKKEDLRRFVADHINDGAWQVVMQFVAGLLEPGADREMSNIDIFSDLLPMSTEKIGTWTCWPAYKDTLFAVNLCKCLNEFDVEQQNSVQRKTAEIGFNAINFQHSSLTPVDCTAIVRFLKNTKEVEYLNFFNNEVGSLGCREIRDALKDVNIKLTMLNLSENYIGDQVAAYLCDALKDVNCKLAVLHLRGNRIGDQGAAYLCDALKDVNCNLTMLDLSENFIGDQGAEYLCDALKGVNCNLTVLDLSNNILDEHVGEYLCDALKDVNCNLISLFLSHNNIGEQGAAHLSDALKDVNCNLRFLDLSNNHIGDQVQAQLRDSLSDVNCEVCWLGVGY